MKYLSGTTGAALAAGAVCLLGLARRGPGGRAGKADDGRDDHPRPAGRHLLGHHPQGRRGRRQEGQCKAHLPRQPDGTKEAQLIPTSCSSTSRHRPDARLSPMPKPGGEGGAIGRNSDVGFNAGVGEWKSQDLLGYAGQDETVAGKAVGERLNTKGRKTSSASTSSRARCSSKRAATASRTHSRARWRCSTSPATICRRSRRGCRPSCSRTRRSTMLSPSTPVRARRARRHQGSGLEGRLALLAEALERHAPEVLPVVKHRRVLHVVGQVHLGLDWNRSSG